MQSSHTNRVYIENPMVFQLGPTDENPDGEVVMLQPGWNEIPEKLRDHPLIKRMKPEGEAEAERRQKIQDAEKTRNEAIAKAAEEYNKSVAEAEKNRVEEYASRNEERLERMQRAQEQGVVAYEPHPDPDAQRAETLTLPPSAHMITTAGMAYKGSESVAAAQERVRGAGPGGSDTTAPAPATGTSPPPQTRTRTSG